MAAVPNWLIGKHVTAITVAGVTAATDGTLTITAASAGNPQSLAGYIDGIDFTIQNTTENIQSIDQRRANYVITESETSFTLTEILKTNDSAGAPKNILAPIGMLYDYALVTLTRGGRTWSFMSVVGSYSESINKGKSTGKIELKMVDPGTSNPIYS
jgi:hypothetical protein